MIFGLIIRGPPKPMEFPCVFSRAQKGQFNPPTQPLGDGPSMEALEREKQT